VAESEKASLAGCWTKIARARQHAQRLEEITEAFLQRRPIQVSFDDHSEPPALIIRAVVEPVPPEFSTVAGDLVHNLRSSLDHLAWQLVLVSGGSPRRHTSFPLMRTPSEFEKRVRNPPKDRQGPLHGIDPAGDIWAGIERSQPYKPAMGNLEILPLFTNRDKHQGLLVGVSWSPGIPVDDLFSVEGGGKVSIEPLFESPGALQHDAPIARVNAPQGRVNMKGDPPFEITVSDGEEWAVSIGALDRLRSQVVFIIRSFEKFF
jgi:hypothetical protein